MHKSYVKYVHDMPISVVNLCSIIVMLMHTPDKHYSHMVFPVFKYTW